MVTKDEREFTDIMLGIKNGRITSFSTDETRWGITLPIHRDTGGEISIQPHPRKGQLTFKSESTGEVINVNVGILIPLSLPSKSDYFKIRFVNDYLTFTLERQNGIITATSETPPEKVLSLEDHISLNTFQRILTGGVGSMVVRDGHKRILNSQFERAAAEDHQNYCFGQRVLTKLKTIVVSAGGASLRLTVAHLNSQVGAIDFVNDLITSTETIQLSPIKIMATDDFPTDLLEAETLVIGRLLFESAAIAFCAIGMVTISGNLSLKTLNVGRLSLRQVEVIGLSDAAYDDFNLDMQGETALRMVITVGDNDGGIYRDPHTETARPSRIPSYRLTAV